MYLEIKKTTEVEEFYNVTKTHWEAERIKAGLESGDLNIIQSATVEPIMWLVNKDGRRIAVLEKDGGTSGAERVEIAIKHYGNSDF
jgi:hypothetical protein